MNYFFLLTVFIVLLGGNNLFGVIPNNDWSEMGLKKKVKEIKTITYKVLDMQRSTNIPSKIREEHTTFSISGYISELSVICPDSECNGKYIFNYDANNSRIGYKYYAPKGWLKVDYTFSNEPYGYIDHKISYTFYKPDGTVYGYCIYYFDKENKLYANTNTIYRDKDVIGESPYLISTNYCSDGFVCNQKDKYDIKRNYYKSNYFNLIEELEHTSYIKYDSQGNIIKSIRHLTFDNVKDLYRYLNGRQVEHIAFVEKKISNRHTSRYNKRGKLIEARFYNYDLGFNKVKFKYDNKGNEIKITYFKPDNTIDRRLIYVFEYDQKGNWIKQYEYENGKNISIKERIIEYLN